MEEFGTREDSKTQRFTRNTVSNLENGKIMPGSTREENGDRDKRIQTEIIPSDYYSKVSVARRPCITTSTTNTTTHGDQAKKYYNKNAVTAREKVKEILQEFRAYCESNSAKRVDYLAARMIRQKFRYHPKRPFLGQVPGVEIGDEFHYRMELNVIGLHCPPQGGIEFMWNGGRIVATSVVDSGGYDNYRTNQDTLIYCGQGGYNYMNNASVGLELAEDQELKGGNLALMNTISARNPVRVIRGSKKLRANSTTYFYDGLYTVESTWEDKSLQGKKVFKFKLVRMPGQVSLLARRNLRIESHKKGFEELERVRTYSTNDIMDSFGFRGQKMRKDEGLQPCSEQIGFQVQLGEISFRVVLISVTQCILLRFIRQFVYQPEFNYVGRKVAYFDNVDPDLMSYFEVLDCLKEIGINIEIPIYYMVPNFDLEHDRRPLNFDKIVLEGFEVNRNHDVIAIYSGEDANDNNDVVDINGINNDPLVPVKGDEAGHHEEGIRDANQSEGDNDEEDDELLEFNAENEMQKLELVVGQLFSDVVEFREAVRQHSIINGFRLVRIKHDNNRITIACSKNCGWIIHARNFRGSDDSGWVDTKSIPMGPPQIRKAFGKPKKLRRKGHDKEGVASCNRVSKKGTPMHCNHCSHTDDNVRGCKNIGLIYVRKRKRVQEQGTDSSNLQDIDIGSNPNIGSLDGGRDHVEEQDPVGIHQEEEA
ncbi:hypothetical protein ACH5RR_038916 [Cinchona calisaya]|uniref:YDG domain-containing protein n=1 Tax=Cinchona calisaya TaxID=153742 RepID=A0ABD2XY28_9GENT